MVLDWLEEHLTAGRLPCFFWAEVDLVAGLSTADRQAMIDAVREMRRRAAPLLLVCCERRGWDLDTLLEGGSEPLSEHQLRLRLARHLVRDAVLEGTIYRPAAPCWDSWVA